MIPTAHLIFGFLGAGKTTLARRIERERAAVRFTPDEWMSRLFGEDPPADIFQEKESALVQLMEPLWTRCLSRRVDVVLDYGFWRRRERDEARSLVHGVGARAVLYNCACPEEEARARVMARNAADPRGLYIAPETFDSLKKRFEPLQPDEPHISV